MIQPMVLKLNHRPQINDEVQTRHQRFLRRQSELGIKEPWKIPAGEKYKPSDMGTGEDFYIAFDEIQDNEFTLGGMISYSRRNPINLSDRSADDDKIIIEFKPKDVDYHNLICNVFPKMISAFECYRAVIYGETMTLDEFNQMVELHYETGKDVNGRDGVYQFAPVSFFDRELCRRAFDLTPAQIVERLEGNVESVYEHYDGLIIIYSSAILTKEQMRGVNDKLQPLLAKPVTIRL